jgi:hypothetical protein
MPTNNSETKGFAPCIAVLVPGSSVLLANGKIISNKDDVASGEGKLR